MVKADEDLARRLAAEEQERHDAYLAQHLQREEQIRAQRRARSSGPGVDRRRAVEVPGGQMNMNVGRPLPMGFMPMMGGAGLHQLFGGAGNQREADQQMRRATDLFNMLAGVQGLPGAQGMRGGPMIVRLVPGGVARARGDALGEDQYQQLLHHLFMQQQANRPVGASQTVINAASNVFEVDVNRLAADSRTCSICQCDFETGEQARSLPCFHIFHKECVDRWLATNKTCPVCRADIEGRPRGQNEQRNRVPEHRHQHRNRQ